MTLKDSLDGFDSWLKNTKGMKNKPNISQKRNRYVQTCKGEIEDFLMLHRSEDKNGLIDWMKMDLKLAGSSDEREAINYCIDFLKETSESEETPEDETESVEDEEASLQSQTGFSATTPQNREIIGRVAITIRSQAKPTEFSFWSGDRSDLHVEIGLIVTVIGGTEDSQTQIKIIGMITDLYNTSATDSPIEDFYSTGYGNPNVELATVRPVIKVATVTVINRSDGRFEPPGGNWPVYFASEEEILTAYGSDIPPKYSVLAGFTWDYSKKPIPVFLDSRYLLGYEGAHVNISGASGLATKTSYAVFLISSIISTSQSGTVGDKETVAAVLFNVKEADLMRIDQGPSNIEEVKKKLRSGDKTNILLERSIEEGIDPFSLKSKMEFFAPPDPNNPGKLLTFRSAEKKTNKFSFGLTDLVSSGGTSIFSLFDPEDLNEQASALISSIIDELRESEGINFRPKPNNFKKLIEYLKESTRSKTSKGQQDQWVDIGFTKHHSATISKVANRLSQAVDHRLKGLVLKEDSTGNPIAVGKLRPSDIWVVDISKLHPTGQRLVFTQVYNSLNIILEAKRNKEETIKTSDGELDLKEFPDRVIVFIDELNKFAPSGKYGAELKSHIVDITARGRSIGLSLIGAEQVANQVDDELLSNTSTFVVGRSHAISLKGDVFQWLQGGLKEKAMSLKKGDMIMWHAVHSRPVLISFPNPIHNIMSESVNK